MKKSKFIKVENKDGLHLLWVKNNHAHYVYIDLEHIKKVNGKVFKELNNNAIYKLDKLSK